MKSKAACQLLTALDDGMDAAARLLDPTYAVQQKFDGERTLIHVEKHSITAYNRDGLTSRISKDILSHAQRFTPLAPLMFDGEWIRQVKSFYSFDLLELEGTNLRNQKFIDRIGLLGELLQPGATSFIHAARTEIEEAGKIALLTQIRDSNLEGIVLKRLAGIYTLRRETRDYKHKFTHDASFIVLRRNEKASVDLGVYDDNHKIVDVGSVQIRNAYFDRNLKDGVGTVLEIRYMHAFSDSNQIYQPRMIAIRKDVHPDDCLLSQLRYKAVNPIAL
jgi:bifunctional non-homologous end joining protein LigD